MEHSGVIPGPLLYPERDFLASIHLPGPCSTVVTIQLYKVQKQSGFSNWELFHAITRAKNTQIPKMYPSFTQILNSVETGSTASQKRTELLKMLVALELFCSFVLKTCLINKLSVVQMKVLQLISVVHAAQLNSALLKIQWSILLSE